MISNKLQSIIFTRTFPKFLFPKLIEKNPEPSSNVIDYYKQAHEHYVYTFFYNTQFNFSKNISVNGRSGYIRSPIKLEDTEISELSTIKREKKKGVDDATYFFNQLNSVPIPFVFIPAGNVIDIIADTQTHDDSTYSYSTTIQSSGFELFETSKYRGALMSLDFAASVGVEFVGCHLLEKEPSIVFYQIGFIFEIK